MIADASGRNPVFPAWLHVYVPELNAVPRKALAAGGVSVQEPPEREGDPDRRGGVEDAWWKYVVDSDDARWTNGQGCPAT